MTCLFLSQVSLDLVQQGLNTLWGSFEVKNSRLVKKMLQQFYGMPLFKPGSPTEVVDGIEAIADRFQALPLHFMTFHGGSEVHSNSGPPLSLYCVLFLLNFVISRLTASLTPWILPSTPTMWSTSSSTTFSSCSQDAKAPTNSTCRSSSFVHLLLPEHSRRHLKRTVGGWPGWSY